ncbi:hypothetical protein [Methylobacter sp.]|uniref:hypothetical protein n=1 Tax=Methylobacter sp. TaxID=2051955 RepID=UPI001215707C|nr:hypothetical protein [Methylobacter sp.]TAK61989.1 MAG: hypothetical protein EPO18_12045 [Methylobacter sp.]
MPNPESTDSTARKPYVNIPRGFTYKMNSTASQLDRNKSLAIMSASMLMAILFGLISTTANVIVISITIAVFAGAFLLVRPVWIVWIVMSMGLLVVGIVPLYNIGLDTKAGWAVSIMCFALMPLALFKVATTKSVRKDTPAFIWLLLGFLVYALLNSLVQWHSAEQYVGSLKRYFQMWGLLFSLCWLVFDERHIRRWQMFFMFTALLQLPFAVYERIVWVPLREAIRDSIPGMVPIDVVAGTFGSTLYGGGSSGEMSTFLVIVVAFLLARKMQKTITAGRLMLLIPWVLGPLSIGETKAVVVMLPLMFLVLYRRELLARPHYGVMALAFCILLTVCMGYAYLAIMHTTFDSLVAETLKYNLYEQGYGENYLNRTTVLTFWAAHQGADDPVSFMFGNGLGSSHQQTRGHIDILYPGYGIGLTAASTLLWDTGVFGCSLFIAVFTLAWRTAGQLFRESNEPTVRADATAIQVALSLFIFHIFYRLDLLETVSYQIVFASVLGYLAWLHRRHAVSMAGSLP